RHVIERLSRRTGVAELEIGRRVVELARHVDQSGTGKDVTNHVGYYLIDDGLPQLERLLAFHPRIGEQVVRLIRRHPTITYLGTIAVVSLLIVALLVVYVATAGATVWMMAVVAFLSVIPASDLATSLINWAITLCVKPRPLPKLNTFSGIS